MIVVLVRTVSARCKNLLTIFFYTVTVYNNLRINASETRSIFPLMANGVSLLVTGREFLRLVKSRFTFMVCYQIYWVLVVLTVWDAILFGKIGGSALLWLMLSPFSLRSFSAKYFAPSSI